MSDEASADIFNLIHGEWLPVQRRSGTVEHIAPSRITERIGEDPIVALAWPRPDFNGAAHEFLIGLLSTAAAPSDDDEWAKSWFDPPAPTILAERFAKVAPAFDLDGPGPRFLQDLDPLEDAEEKGVAALLIDAPGAHTLRNNADLFVKRRGTPVLCRATAAMALYTLSAYAPSGGVGHRTSLRGGGPLTTLVVASHESYGATLWGRLWPNVETKEQIGWRTAGAGVDDHLSAIFPWLVPTRTSNPRDGGRRTTPDDVHPLQVYWGMPPAHPAFARGRAGPVLRSHRRGRNCRCRNLSNHELRCRLFRGFRAPSHAILSAKTRHSETTCPSPTRRY